MEQRKTSREERAKAIRRAQEILAKYVPEGRSLADELIAERRAEAAREELDR